MTQKKNLLILITVLTTFLSACTKDPETTPTNTGNTNFSRGVYIINEGNFGVGNASIDFFNRDSNKVIRNIFQVIN